MVFPVAYALAYDLRCGHRHHKCNYGRRGACASALAKWNSNSFFSGGVHHTTTKNGHDEVFNFSLFWPPKSPPHL